MDGSAVALDHSLELRGSTVLGTEHHTCTIERPADSCLLPVGVQEEALMHVQLVKAFGVTCCDALSVWRASVMTRCQIKLSQIKEADKGLAVPTD